MSRLAYELAIHVLQQRIKEKVAVLTDFANSSTQIRFLTNQLAFYDRSRQHGYLSIDDFVRYFVQRMNFTSLTNELEYLFYYYDEEITGYLDYKHFVNQLYQSTQYYLPVLTFEALNTFEQIRSSFISPERNEQHDFLRFVLRLRDLIRSDADGFASRAFVVDQFKKVIATSNNQLTVSEADLSATMKFFDFRHNESVHIPTLFRYLKSIISPYRKRLVQAVYKMIASISNNNVTVRDIKKCYHFSPSTPVRFRGRTFSRAALDELLRYFFISDTDRMQDSWRVTKDMFYEYYHCISLAIESDDLFELIIRHSWSIPNALLFGKPMANVGENVFERAISTSFDTATTNDELPSQIPSFASHSIDLNSVISKSVDLGSLASQSLDDEFMTVGLELSPPRSRKTSPTAVAAQRAPTLRRIVTRRLTVVHPDDSEEVVTIEEEVGVTKFDHESISHQLKTMGITDIKSIKV